MAKCVAAASSRVRVHKEDVAGALAGIFTMGIAMNDDKVYLVVTQKEASA